MQEQPRPIFEQPSLEYCLGPGIHGQRLLNSTLIRRRALSDFRLQSSRETRNLVVTSIPHRLSVHTGKMFFCVIHHNVFSGYSNVQMQFFYIMAIFVLIDETRLTLNKP